MSAVQLLVLVAAVVAIFAEGFMAGVMFSAIRRLAKGKR